MIVGIILFLIAWWRTANYSVTVHFALASFEQPLQVAWRLHEHTHLHRYRYIYICKSKWCLFRGSANLLRRTVAKLSVWSASNPAARNTPWLLYFTCEESLLFNTFLKLKIDTVNEEHCWQIIPYLFGSPCQYRTSNTKSSRKVRNNL